MELASGSKRGGVASNLCGIPREAPADTRMPTMPKNEPARKVGFHQWSCLPMPNSTLHRQRRAMDTSLCSSRRLAS